MSRTAPSPTDESGSPSAVRRLVRRGPVVALAAWNAFVFSTRISNVLADEQATSATKAWAIALAGLMLVGVVALVAVLISGRARAWQAAEVRVVQAVAALTTVVWVIRGVEIATANYADNPSITSPTAFKAVHLVLGVISIVLAALSWRTAGREQAAGRHQDCVDGPAPAVSPVREAVR